MTRRQARVNYERRFFGRVGRMFNAIYHGRRRAWDVTVTLEELKQMAWNSLTYWKLYEDWVNAGYPRRLCPSIDRVDNSRGYHPNNIQFLSQSENRKKDGTPVVLKKDDEVLQFASLEHAAY